MRVFYSMLNVRRFLRNINRVAGVTELKVLLLGSLLMVCFDGYSQNIHQVNNKVGIGNSSPEGQLHIGSNDGERNGVYKTRLTLEPPAHTGGGWDFKTKDDPISAYLSLGYGNEIMTLVHSGNVGIGTSDPKQRLDVAGNLLLRNYTNQIGGGTFISFSSYDASSAGPRIRSYLDYAHGTESSSRLILSSYSNGYQDEVTLMQGKVGIGTLNPSDKLSVNGNIRAREIKVDNSKWPDYVFEPSYISSSLEDVERFIKANKHLPDIPSAKDVRENGVNLGEMNAKLLMKIEEMTLYLIEQNRRLGNLQAEVAELRKAK